jgi:broad specificity phosphatase PhoE
MNDNDERQRRRKRRRKRRLVAIAGFAVMSIGMAWFFESQATTTIIVTRYADKAELAGSDPGLNPDGQRRARGLARVLKDVDVVAGVDAIYVAPNRRSRETTVPLSIRTDAPVKTIDDPTDVEALVREILVEYKGKIVLVVTEPDLMQPLIAEMQGSKKLPPIAPLEYDNLYIVTIPWFGKVKTLRLKYGYPYIPPQPAQAAP